MKIRGKLVLKQTNYHLDVIPKIYLSSDTTGIPLKNQRTNGPVNAHLISGPSKSTKQTKPGNKYEKDLINNS